MKAKLYDPEMEGILQNSVEVLDKAVVRAKQWYDSARKKRNNARRRLVSYQKRFSK